MGWFSESRNQGKAQEYFSVMLLGGAYLSVTALLTGTIPLGKGDITRATAPLLFWIAFLLIVAATVVVIRWFLRSQDSQGGDVEGIRRKMFQYLGLFCFLLAVYAVYVSAYFDAVVLKPSEAARDALPPLLIRCSLIAAVPFVWFAYSDEKWTSNDAAPACGFAWLAVCKVFSCKCEICVLGLMWTFVPFILATLLGHGLGKLAVRTKSGGLKSLFPQSH